VQGGQRVGRDCNSDVLKFSDNWLEFYIVYSVQRLDHFKIIFLLFVLLNRGFDWGEVLVVTDVDVV
jgi:hypothetical protein